MAYSLSLSVQFPLIRVKLFPFSCEMNKAEFLEVKRRLSSCVSGCVERKKVICNIRNTLQTKAARYFQKLNMSSDAFFF